MPTFYGPRKTRRGVWTQENLDNALKDLQDRNVSIRKAALDNNIPEKTLRNRLKQNNFIKGTLGRKCHLGEETEKQLVQHITRLQSAGFALSRKNLRKIAFDLSEKMGLKQTFNTKKRIAGLDWYKSFMKRNPTLKIRKTKGISNTSETNKQDINNYFYLLKQCLNDNNLINKPNNIYNMAETNLQLNNEPDLTLATKRNTNVQDNQCTERGETITIVACCNAEGSFLAPYCIFNGVSYFKNQQMLEENMPLGSVIQMRKESANIDEKFFLDWLKNHFIPKKNEGPCLLILNSHGFYSYSPNMLQMAIDNNIHILYLPWHNIHYLQPLDRFFESLKTYFRDASCEWSNIYPTERIKKIHFGLLFAKAWSRAATTQMGISGFRETGIYPFCPISEHIYMENVTVKHEESSSSESECNKEILHEPAITISSSSTQMCMTDESMAQSDPNNLYQQPVSSLAETSIKAHQAPVYSRSSQETLNEISPIPMTDYVQASSSKQSAIIATTPPMIDVKNKKQRSMESTCIINKDKVGSSKEKHETENLSSLRVSMMKNENAVSTMNNFVYIDTNQQNSSYNNQMDYLEENLIDMGQDPLEFAMQTNENQQLQHIINFKDTRLNEGVSIPKQDKKTLISKDTITPAIDLLAKIKTHSWNPEMIFFKSLLPDIMKLSDKKRRQFKEVVLSTLNKLLDEDNNITKT